MNIPYIMKKCSKCGRWLVANTVNFHKGKGYKYGLRSKCKECDGKYSKEYRENNKDRISEKNKQYYQDNRDWIDKRHKQWSEANGDRIAMYNKRYRESPQGQATTFNKRQRRRIKEEQQGAGITKDQWLECMSFFDWRCAYSGEYIGGKQNHQRTIDHVVPLNSGGDNMIWNMIPMTKSLNCSKQDKDMLEWYKEQDCYSEARLAKSYEWQEYDRKKWKNS